MKTNTEYHKLLYIARQMNDFENGHTCVVKIWNSVYGSNWSSWNICLKNKKIHCNVPQLHFCRIVLNHSNYLMQPISTNKSGCQPQTQIYVTAKLCELPLYYELFTYQMALISSFLYAKSALIPCIWIFFQFVQRIFAQPGNMSDLDMAGSKCCILGMKEKKPQDELVTTYQTTHEMLTHVCSEHPEHPPEPEVVIYISESSLWPVQVISTHTDILQSYTSPGVLVR